MRSWSKSKILPFLQGLLLLVPINVYIIGDWLGTGIQWAFFRYQQTYLGSNLIFIYQDLNYIFNGFVSNKTGFSIGVWIIGLIFIVLALLLSTNIPEKMGVSYAGIFIILSGIAFLLSDVIQYGIFLHGPAGICIPIGIPVIFIVGWGIYADTTKSDAKSYKRDFLSVYSLIKKAAISFFSNHTGICIFLILYFAYNTIFIVNTNGDTIPATFLPISILQYHNLFFDQFGKMAINGDTSYAYLLINSHFYSLFPVVTPILVTPIYAVSLVLFQIFSVPLSGGNILLIAKICASIVTATSGVLVYLVAKEFSTKKIALLATFIYAFATSTWSISSQALWQHGMGALLLILMIYYIVKNERKTSEIYFMILGILSGLFFFNRPADAILLIPVFLYIGKYYSKYIISYAVSGAVAALPFLLYNILIFNNLFGGYNDSFRFFNINYYEIIKNFVGMFIAPNYGALIFSPILIFAIIGYLLLPKKNLNPLQELLILFFPCILADFLIYSAFGAWRGSIYSYGPRYITGILPILILYLVAFFNYHFPNRECSSKKVGVTIVIVLFLFISVFIQFIGVYYYAYLPVKGMNEQRAWDWNDSVIIGSFDAGFGKNITVTMYSFNPFPPIISYQFIQRSDTSPTQYLIQSMNASRNY